MSENKGSFCRIAWEIGSKTGHGDWHDAESQNVLQSHIDRQNEAHGAGSHRIEWNDGNDAMKEVEAIIKKTSTRAPSV